MTDLASGSILRCGTVLSYTALVPLTVLVVVAMLAGCQPERTSTPQPTEPTMSAAATTTPGRTPGTREVATNLAVPWGVAFLPTGDALVAERDSARIVLVRPSGEAAEVGRVPGVRAGGEGGLLGIAMSPGFARDRLVYAYYTTARDNRIARMTYRDGRLGAPRPILTGIPSGTLHNGGRLLFGPDGTLYASTGDTHEEGLAQDRASLGGKILRMTPEGRPAPGNPFGGSVVYSYGHRNVQGLAFDSKGRLWASEFGADAWDELNLIRPGGNYGWPAVEGMGDDDRFVNPAAVWRPEQASPSGIAIVDDVIYMASLRGQRLWRMPIRGADVGPPAALLTERYGRLRTVTLAPDGSLWLTTSNRDGRGDPRPDDDRIIRVLP